VKGLERYCVLAGALDAVTGASLVAAPGVVLRWLGIAEPPDGAVFLRWIGAFVGAVGVSYLYPFVLSRSLRSARLRVVLEVTAIERLGVFCFVTLAIGAGALAARWSTVALTDLALGAAQLWMTASWRQTPGAPSCP
jgi:hypothetical protein